MFYAIYVPPNGDLPDGEEQKPQAEDLVFSEIKEANAALKRYKGSRMKTFPSRERALSFLRDPERDETLPTADEAEPTEYPSAKPAMLNQLRRKIESGDYEAVEQIIWSNPRCLVSVCDTAIYLMAGPKYNACHIAARANKPDIMALILDTISNFGFIRKLYPKESDSNLQDRINHLLDSYLNTPDPRQGNTPLHFACKLGHYRVVRVLLTFEGCDLTLRDSNGQTAEESICSQYKPPLKDVADQFKELSIQESGEEVGDGTTRKNDSQIKKDDSEDQLDNIKQKIRNMFKQQFHLPLYRDRLKKRLILQRRRSQASSLQDSDTSFSDIDDSFILNSPTKLFGP
jgi:hypothetical protein